MDPWTKIKSQDIFDENARWTADTLCGFCNQSGANDEFTPQAFAISNKKTALKESVWAHESCCRSSPEVYVSEEGTYHNVSSALKRGRAIKCSDLKCKNTGATVCFINQIGCFNSKCPESYHLKCSGKPMEFFTNGEIFFCPVHEIKFNRLDKYEDVYSCDVCSSDLKTSEWLTCNECSQDYYSTFDLCSLCFEQKFPDHAHDKTLFSTICITV